MFINATDSKINLGHSHYEVVYKRSCRNVLFINTVIYLSHKLSNILKISSQRTVLYEKIFSYLGYHHQLDVQKHYKYICINFANILYKRSCAHILPSLL